MVYVQIVSYEKRIYLLRFNVQNKLLNNIYIQLLVLKTFIAHDTFQKTLDLN